MRKRLKGSREKETFLNYHHSQQPIASPFFEAAAIFVTYLVSLPDESFPTRAHFHLWINKYFTTQEPKKCVYIH